MIRIEALLCLAILLAPAASAEEASVSVPALEVTTETSATVEVAPVSMTDADLTQYLAGYPKMLVFMNKKGQAMEKAQGNAIAGMAESLGMEAEFQKEVGIPFARYFQMHNVVSAAFAEAIAERSREEQKKSLSASIEELKKQIAAKDTSAEAKAALQEQLGEMEQGLAQIDQPFQAEPSLTGPVREIVRKRLDEVEKAYTSANLETK